MYEMNNMSEVAVCCCSIAYGTIPQTQLTLRTKPSDTHITFIDWSVPDIRNASVYVCELSSDITSNMVLTVRTASR